MTTCHRVVGWLPTSSQVEASRPSAGAFALCRLRRRRLRKRLDSPTPPRIVSTTCIAAARFMPPELFARERLISDSQGGASGVAAGSAPRFSLLWVVL